MQDTSSAEHEPLASAHGGRPHHNQHLALFLGATDEKGHDAEFSFGVDYLHLIAAPWSAGLLAEYTGGTLRNTVLAAQLAWHPSSHWKFVAAPGVEFHDGKDETTIDHSKADTHGEADRDATYFLFRVGVVYAFFIGDQYGIAPTVNLDFVNDLQVWVYGLNFYVAW